jgi:hypothetical protein
MIVSYYVRAPLHIQHAPSFVFIICQCNCYRGVLYSSRPPSAPPPPPPRPAMVRKTRTVNLSSEDVFAGSFSRWFSHTLLYNSLCFIPSRYRSLRSMSLGKQSPASLDFRPVVLHKVFAHDCRIGIVQRCILL